MSLVCTTWEELRSALAQGVACRIEGLTGDFRFLSNFHPAPIEVDRIVYPTSEHAYQAAKTTDRAEKLTIAALPSPGRAKRYRMPIHADWADVKLGVMESLIALKFGTHRHLCLALCATGNCVIEETNTWGDRFWGVCNGTGENHLGLILMQVRESLREEVALTEQTESRP